MLPVISLYGTGPDSQAADTPPPVAASGRPQPVVLVIDDDPAVRILARNCLHGFGFDIEEASGGEQGLEVAARVQPDLILCDVMMPGMDGFEVCSELRKIKGCEHVPVVMLTGLDDMDSIEQAYSAGATEFIVKPINWGLLPRRVRYIVRASTATEELRRSEERYALAAQGANDGLWDWDLLANKLYLSARWYELLGETNGAPECDPEEWLGRVHLDDADRVNAEIAAHLEGSTEQFQSEYRMRMADGSFRWMLSRGIAVRDANDEPCRFAGSHTDISERKQAEEQLQFDALHDTLTGLPNRALFMDRLSHCIQMATRRPDYHFGALFMDLDRFKLINDTLGHLKGDLLLIEVSRRIAQCLRTEDTLARLGGDEFVILFEDVSDITTVTRTAKRIQAAIAEPMMLDGQEVVTSSSMGIAFSDHGYQHPEEMLRDADAAMYRAKALGRARCEVFDIDMHIEAVDHLRTERELRAAIANDEFFVEYQPIIDLNDDRVRGFEALLRWRHPERGVVMPEEFLQVAEDTRLLVGIGRTVLDIACRQLCEWRERWPEAGEWTMSVNLSSLELAQQDVVASVDAALENSGLPATALKLEITESSLIRNTDHALTVMNELKSRGVALSIDDFGTGYSSLSYLHKFPFDTLKIDRSFISNIDNEPQRLEIVKAIVSMADKLGLDVVAEGSETAGSLACIKSFSGACAQGHMLARPQSAQALSEELASRLGASAGLALNPKPVSRV